MFASGYTKHVFDTGIFPTVNIFHIAEPEAWASRGNTYVPDSYEVEGFIHCSTEGQLSGIAETFYAGRDDLLLLTIETAKLGELVVFEDLYEMGEDFPHIYGPLPISAIVEVGSFSVPTIST